MRARLERRIHALEARYLCPNIPVDFLGLWDPDDPEWETVDVEGAVPDYIKRLLIQRHKTTAELRGLLNTPAEYPLGADHRFL